MKAPSSRSGLAGHPEIRHKNNVAGLARYMEGRKSRLTKKKGWSIR